MKTPTGHDHVAPLSRVALLACEYAYDATGLLARIVVPGQTGERFWRGNYSVNELRTSASGSAQLTWLRAVGQPIVEQVSGTVARMTLLATAISGSVLLEADTAVRQVAYAPHGSRSDGEQAVGAAEAEPAFNGELLDAASGCYLLGAGHHRPYSPRLGIFLAADGLSPFGAGGLNPYAYCAGDPVNRSDPTGHFWKWIVAAVGIAVGVAAVAVTFGAASKAVAAVATVGFSALTKSTAGAIASTTLGIVAVGAEVGAIAAEVSGDTKTATILGFVGLALGIVAAAPAIAKAATKGAAKFSRFTKRIATIRSQGLSGRGAGRAAANRAQELSPASARRAAVQRMTAGRFRNPLANGATSVPDAAPRSSVLSDGFLTRLRESEGLSLVRQRRASPEVPDFQPPPRDPTKAPLSPPWTTRHWGVAVESAGSPSNINVNSHIDYMIQTVPEAARRSRAVRRAAAVKPPSYDQATLPSYESTLPPSYDSHGFP
ncbi:RHS repeat-associated core domain-containing protein [Stenotrophomonas sp. PS02289]|uniref:RHS repeat-associated core domain-containing protein n=1 Tax=Stenotrophomonas sp. PS02289 TaxID=2991422 RepID=UPI00249C4E95|nr:RHS repeat-associated core domain-containing protein [Stenotrophomonas sp. PS02289]